MLFVRFLCLRNFVCERLVCFDRVVGGSSKLRLCKRGGWGMRGMEEGREVVGNAY